jgi:hypothetical protein
MSEHTPNTTGRGKYSKVIRNLHDTISALETRCNWSLFERDAKINALLKALEQIAAMDPEGIRADDLGRAARIARTGITSVVGNSRDPEGGK